MDLKTLADFDLQNKTILYRSPYDIETVEEGGRRVLKDNSRIKATLPTLHKLLDLNCKIVILTFVGRPDGKVVEELHTDPQAKELEKLLNREVKKLDDCVGEEVREFIAKMKPGEMVMLENTRFKKGEIEDNDDLALELSRNGEFVVFDGFPQAHRVHASTTGILRHLPSCAGEYFMQEIRGLEQLKTPKDHFTIILGGKKVSDKIPLLHAFAGEADEFLIGGAAANVFLQVKGKTLGDSIIEDISVQNEKGGGEDLAQTVTKILRDDRVGVFLPKDLIVTNSLENPEEIKMVDVASGPALVPDGFASADIGPKTIEAFSQVLSESQTIFWNGPMGLSEKKEFAKGTKEIAERVAESDAFTVISGGDTVDAVKEFVNLEKFDHVSLAGGATLNYLAGETLPVIEYLSS